MTAIRKNKSGFTLIEILIVVIILGILAAIVIPQFTNASQDARRSSLASQVQTLRAQVELYKLQHGDTLPDLVTSWAPFTGTTTYGGKTFGPYMQSEPTNGLMNNVSTVKNGTAVVAGDTQAFVYDYGTAGSGSGKLWGIDKATDGTLSLMGG